MAPPKIGRKKEGLKQFLDRVEGTDDPEFIALCEESKKYYELARGFRWASPSTQLEQDQQITENDTRVGIWEILQMMDFDMNQSPCFALAECHHLAWILGRLAALPPSSLGPPQHVHPKDHLPFIAWRDCEIERANVNGKFSVRLTIRNVKTDMMNSHPGEFLYLSNPIGKQTFQMSAPHRLLTIAIRRGVLDGIQTIDELFKRRNLFITIKKEFLDKPVFVTGTQHDLDVDLDKPMASEAFTDYLQLCAEKVGIPKSITFHNLRCDTAQELLEKVRPEQAKEMTAQDPNSTIAEGSSAGDRTELLNLTAIALGEDRARHDYFRDMLSATKLSDDNYRVLSRILNELFEQLRNSDDEYPHNGDSASKQNRDRVLQRAAFQCLMKDLREKLMQELTVEGIRTSDLQSMSNEFNRRIIAQAKASVGPQNSDSDLIEEDSLRTLGVEEDLTTGVSERDAEGQFQERIEHDKEAQTLPDEVPIGDVLDQMDYATVARYAMEIWLSAGTETSSWGRKQAKMTPCRSCQADETVDDETKSKNYEASNLKRHLDGDFHSRFEQFSRRAQIVARDEGLPGVRCEICVAVAPPGTVIPLYATVASLARHITDLELTKM
ncbi:hypothetical protein BKA56DRAFT_669462 [Ilyonectria sp. MPI-CAGE-AT-0026]|nr:hypothetical protein BKA56DRAFT_669462 [Ilyonectria sp. MPI-CAGE-AT-0026]